MEANKYLQKAKELNAKAENEALFNRLDAERMNMIQTYESNYGTYKVLAAIVGILWVICFIWFLSCDKYTDTSFFFFSMKTISFSYAFSIVGLVVMSISAIIIIYALVNAKNRIKELQNCSPWEYQKNKNLYIFENKGILGFLTKH